NTLGVVFLRPSTNSVSICNACNIPLMAGPPPWTITGCFPFSFILHILSKKDGESSSTVEPPHFTTTIYSILSIFLSTYVRYPALMRTYSYVKSQPHAFPYPSPQ